jgi:hypothetical protein
MELMARGGAAAALGGPAGNHIVPDIYRIVSIVMDTHKNRLSRWKAPKSYRARVPVVRLPRVTPGHDGVPRRTAEGTLRAWSGHAHAHGEYALFQPAPKGGSAAQKAGDNHHSIAERAQIRVQADRRRSHECRHQVCHERRSPD